MNKLLLAYKVFQVKFLKKRIPLFVTIRVTNRCNFNCIYCDFNTLSGDDISEEELLKAITEIKRSGAFKIGFTGGEPLLREDIGRLVTYAKNIGLMTTMTTNGWHVKERIEDLKDLDVIILSLDGSRENHDKQRREGSFDRIMDAIHACNEKGITVLILTVLTKYNLNEVDYILDLANKYSCDAIFQPVEKRDFFSSGLENIAPSRDNLIPIIEKLITYKKEGRPIYDSIAYLQLLLQWPKCGDPSTCWAGKLSCIVNVDGTVRPCNNCTKKEMFPNGFEVGFSEAFRMMGKCYCSGCWTNCYQENNVVMELNPMTIRNALSRIKDFSTKNNT